MRLVACSTCHLQYDVSSIATAKITCACGAEVDNVVHAPVDLDVRRCASCGASVERKAKTCEYCKSTIERDAGKLSLICPECYVRNPDHAKFCAGCGVAFQPQEVRGGADSLNCPDCEKPMKIRGIAGLPVSECPRCHGLWVPADNFDMLINRAVDAMRSQPRRGLGMATGKQEAVAERDWAVRYRKCPVCEGVMQRKNFGGRSGVIVDWCGRDGTWLEADELEEISAFIHAGGLAVDDATGTDGRPHSAEQFDAMIAAESWMAEERTRSRTPRGIDAANRDVNRGSFLGDLLGALLDW